MNKKYENMKGKAKCCDFFVWAFILKVVPFNDVWDTFYIMEILKFCLIYTNLKSNCIWQKMKMFMQNLKYGRDRGLRDKTELIQYLLIKTISNMQLTLRKKSSGSVTIWAVTYS